jgi:hypothetical protein
VQHNNDPLPPPHLRTEKAFERGKTMYVQPNETFVDLVKRAAPELERVLIGAVEIKTSAFGYQQGLIVARSEYGRRVLPYLSRYIAEQEAAVVYFALKVKVAK